MRSLLSISRRWAGPAAAAVFFVAWCVAEWGEMGPIIGFFPTYWTGTVPLLVLTAAIGTAVRWPVLSLCLTALLLLGQLLRAVSSMDSSHWAMYVGSFIALGLIAWTGSRRIRIIAALANVFFAAVMTFLMLSWRYGHGRGFGADWLPTFYAGDRATLATFAPQLFLQLLLIAGSFFAAGLLLALVQERGSLFRARELAQSTLKDREIDLVVEQERTRISRDLHDVLAHSLAVIAAQADGARYSVKDQPEPVLKALETIASSARSALVDAQRVIEGVEDDGMRAPQPRLNDIAGLIDGMSSSLEITRGTSGHPVDLSDGQQLAVFRIVQECLTNALKHVGRGTTVRLHFDWSGPGLTMHAASGLPERHGSEEAQARRPGRGIPGMRERAHLAGGWLTAGPDGEQFRVTLFLPYGPGENRPAAASLAEDPAPDEPEHEDATRLALSTGEERNNKNA